MKGSEHCTLKYQCRSSRVPGRTARGASRPLGCSPLGNLLPHIRTLSAFERDTAGKHSHASKILCATAREDFFFFNLVNVVLELYLKILAKLLAILILEQATKSHSLNFHTTFREQG
ncbi:hypothetical protein NPIL_141671 [Nephila pilipes]|uniref:Uncharacterized protein n=1 Tax=Nephila pilipes TaxID=299642 RepID=A0A8X6IDY7_NEPPI|nr:hypothetical protein NPIL_141671 [Nephila pilipes]